MRRGARQKPLTPAQVRVQRDLDEFDPAVYPGVQICVPDRNNLQDFFVRLQPANGIWRGGKFDFRFTIPDDFPFERPTVKCETRVWHPNIEETGAVCLNILRDNYTPVTSICHLIVGLQFLFTEPNPESPLNEDAANMFKSDLDAFTARAHDYMTLYCPR
jgi:ubiquitin-conjugating enzyme E2 M